jgi:glycosyltransferase involved in cell wall biosynthesis
MTKPEAEDALIEPSFQSDHSDWFRSSPDTRRGRLSIVLCGASEYGSVPEPYEYATLLQTAGHEVHYLGASVSGTGFAVADENVPTWHADRRLLAEPHRLCTGMGRVLRSIRPDIIHVFHFRGCGLLRPLTTTSGASWIIDVRTVHVENGDRTPSRHTWAKNRLTWIEAQMFDRIFVLTDELERLMRPSRAPVTKLPLGGSMARLNPANREDLRRSIRTAHRIPFGAPVVIYSGSISPAREIWKILASAAQASKTAAGMYLLILGGDDDPSIQRQLAEYARGTTIAERIMFLGRVPYTQVPDYYCAADIGVCYVPPDSAYKHQPPTKIIEYMMAGLIAISNRTPVAESLLGPFGFLCESTVDALAESMVAAVAALPSRSSIASTARAAVEGSDWGMIVNSRILPLYQDIRRQ